MAASDASSDTETYDYIDMERELASMLSAGQDPEPLENMAMYHSQVHTYIHTLTHTYTLTLKSTVWRTTWTSSKPRARTSFAFGMVWPRIPRDVSHYG